MAFYRREFLHPSVLPKMHFLEEHVVPWIKNWGAAPGMMGEQGTESIHANFNRIELSYRNMIHNRVERLKSVVQQHHLQISPQNLKLNPVTRKRPRDE